MDKLRGTLTIKIRFDETNSTITSNDTSPVIEKTRDRLTSLVMRYAICFQRNYAICDMFSV